MPLRAAQTTVLDAQVVQRIAHAVQHIRYGSVTLVIHNAQVTAIEATEKVRLTPSGVEAIPALPADGTARG